MARCHDMTGFRAVSALEPFGAVMKFRDARVATEPAPKTATTGQKMLRNYNKIVRQYSHKGHWSVTCRVYDNIFIERLWWTVKYEHVYLHSYDSVHTAWCGLNNYFKFCNEEQLHGSLNKRTHHDSIDIALRWSADAGRNRVRLISHRIYYRAPYPVA